MSFTSPNLTLSQLADQIKGILNSSFSGKFFWVIGEVSGHKYDHAKKRHFLELIEKKEGESQLVAKIRATIWSDFAQKVTEFERTTGQEFKNGLQILIKVSVEFHTAYGLNLIVSDIDASFTLGNLEKQRLDTLMRLVKEPNNNIKQEGDVYITPNKRLSLKRVLQKIALVASPNSEGLHDFMSNLTANHFSYAFNVVTYYTTVQGASASEDLKNALLEIYNSGISYDCVVIIRGGGAKTDFVVFDTYAVAQIVARFPVPVITGIGHLRDISITDMMAHTNTNAPTKAAEFIVAHNRKFEDEVIEMQRKIVIWVQQYHSGMKENLQLLNSKIINSGRSRIQQRKDELLEQKQNLSQNSKEIIFRSSNKITFTLSKLITSSPQSIKNANKEIKNQKDNLTFQITQFLTKQFEFLRNQTTVVKLMDPKNILNKGFTLIKSEGKILTTAENIKVGDELTISFSDSDIKTKVTKK